MEPPMIADVAISFHFENRIRYAAVVLSYCGLVSVVPN